MKTNWIGFLALVSITAWASESGDSWRHANLTASDGTRISIDYLVQPVRHLDRTYLAAQPIWINVTHPRLTGQEKVHVILVNSRESDSVSVSQNELVLTYAGDSRFTVQAPALIFLTTEHGFTDTFSQEIAVAVDGAWLKDPISTSPNFRFKF